MIVAILQFLQAKGAGEACLRRLLNYSLINGIDNAVSLCNSAHMLTAELNIRPDISSNIVTSLPQAQSLAERLINENIGLTWIGDDIYPLTIINILKKSSPPVLFYKGNVEIFNQPGVGFCGSRKASDKGLVITKRCAEQLVHHQICIVSGYAYGVDMAAHQAALENSGNTIFVLADGILRFKHKKEVLNLLSDCNHLAISQFPPNMSWSGINAMKRNGTIIGLSKAMILVESGITGGTFAAGEETLRRNEPLFVIDFSAPGPSAEANPHFIRQGGIAIRGTQDGIPNLQKVFTAVEYQNSLSSRRSELLESAFGRTKSDKNSFQGSLL